MLEAGALVGPTEHLKYQPEGRRSSGIDINRLSCSGHNGPHSRNYYNVHIMSGVTQD
jgi:hypothetical protein